MSEEQLFRVQDAVRATGKQGYHKLIKSLVRHHNIPHFLAGNAMMFNQASMDLIVEAVHQWDARPRINPSRQPEPANAAG